MKITREKGSLLHYFTFEKKNKNDISVYNNILSMLIEYMKLQLFLFFEFFCLFFI